MAYFKILSVVINSNKGMKLSNITLDISIVPISTEFRLFKTYVYKYAYFTIPNNNKSTFHNDHDNYQKIYKNMNYLILNDIFDKYF